MVLGINLSLSSPPKLSLSTWLAQQWSDFPHQPEKNGFLTRILSICKSHADEALKIAGPSQCWPSWVLHAAWTLQWLSLCLLDLLLFLIFTRPWHSTVYLEKVRPKGEAIRKGSQQTSGSQSKGKNSRKLTGSWKNVPSECFVKIRSLSLCFYMYIYIHVELNHFAVCNRIQHCKSIILQKKKLGKEIFSGGENPFFEREEKQRKERQRITQTTSLPELSVKKDHSTDQKTREFGQQ